MWFVIQKVPVCFERWISKLYTCKMSIDKEISLLTTIISPFDLNEHKFCPLVSAFYSPFFNSLLLCMNLKELNQIKMLNAFHRPNGFMLDNRLVCLENLYSLMFFVDPAECDLMYLEFLALDIS